MPTCSCPITKTLEVFYQVTDPPATDNHQFKWRVVGDASYTTVTPNPTPIFVSAPDNYKVQIPNVPTCQDVEVTIQRQCANNQNSPILTTVVPAGVSYGCTQSISGSNTISSFYAYPTVLLDLRAAPDTITFNYYTVDRNNPTAANPPNRFLIKNAAGATVFSSGWKGQADYIGEWGTSLNTATSGSFTVTKSVSDCFFTLQVDTIPNGNMTDVWSLDIDCTNTVTPPVDPTITFVSCNSGIGRYTIDGTAGSIIKVSISSSDLLTNTNAPNNCARMDVSLSSSTGPTTSAVSAQIPSSGTALVGGSNSVFLTLTIPASGSLTIDTSVIYMNSAVSVSAWATLQIFEVDGVAKTIVRSLCIGSQTGSVPCTVPTACTCPTGYTLSPDGSTCVKEETVAATAPTATVAQRTLYSSPYSNYSRYGTVIYTGGFNATTGVALGSTTNLTSNFWSNFGLSTSAGPLNRTALWTLNKPDAQRISFSICLNTTQTKTYLVGLGCDNQGDIKLNGTSVVTQDANAMGNYFVVSNPGIVAETSNSNTAPFTYWHIYPVQIPAGNNVLEIGGYNISNAAGIGVEVYDATPGDLAAAVSYGDLGSKLLFSTKDLFNTAVVGGDSGYGYSCPTGYVLKTCGLTTPICYKVSTTPCSASGSGSTITYNFYFADKYSCTNCGGGVVLADVVVAIDSTITPTLNAFYLPRDKDGFSYKIKSLTTTTGPGLIMSNIYRSQCSSVCVLNTECFTVLAADPNSTVTVRYTDPVTGNLTNRVCTTGTIIEVIGGTIPSIISGNGSVFGPNSCIPTAIA